MTTTDISNRLSELRNEIKGLDDLRAMYYITHAIDQHHHGHVGATETWLELAIKRIDEITSKEARHGSTRVQQAGS